MFKNRELYSVKTLTQNCIKSVGGDTITLSFCNFSCWWHWTSRRL